MTLRFQKSLQQQQSGEVVHPAPTGKVTIRNCSSTAPDPAIVTLSVPKGSAASDSKLVRIRDGLLRLKRKARDREMKIEISELLDIIDEADREDALFSEWCERHASAWEPTDMERQMIRAFLASGEDGISRELGDSILSNGEAAPIPDRRSSPRLRNFFTRQLRPHLLASGSTVEIKAGRDGIYRTTDPVILTCGDVSHRGDR